MKAHTARRQRRLPQTFLDLNTLRPLRPINDDVDLQNAQEVSDRLAILDKRTEDQDDYLQTLALLIEKYEQEHSPIETRDLSPVEMLKYLMGGRGMSASDLGRLLGERSLGAAILRGDRKLSQSHVRTLCAHFGIGPAVFFRV